MRSGWGLCTVLALPLIALGVPIWARPVPLSLQPVHADYPDPQLPFDEPEAEGPGDDTLATAIAETFVSNPSLAASRYDLRAEDDEIGIAMSQSRPQVQVQLTGSYDYILPGSITQASRPLSERLNNPHIERNSLTSQLVVDQPLWTGGRASSALTLAGANSTAGRARLRGIEGDLLLELIAAYCDVRRDTRVLAIRGKTVRVLEATLDEIVARREAGELTRTDISQAESQLLAARAQLSTAEAQLETSRAAFTAIVGREPGVLAPAPDLPGLPGSAQEAFARAELANPELAQAMASERAARARIGLAEAQGRPELSLRASAGTSGPALPFYASEHDTTFTGQVSLSVPLFTGGRVRAAVAQARNRQSAEALKIEATRRALTQAVVGAWNQWVTAARNVEALELQRRAARVFYEGTFEEYREGLRSTFDVLYAQNSLRETEIALLSSKRDSYVAQAVLLRRMGQLEAGKLLSDGPGYDPGIYRDKVRGRGAVPWGGAIRAIDRIGAPGGEPRAAEWPEPGDAPPQPAPAGPIPAPNELLRGKPGPSAGPDQLPTPKRD